MRRGLEQDRRSARRRRETLFLLLLVLLLLGWLEVALRTTPQPVPPGEGATWSTLVERLYGRVTRELDRHLAAHPARRDGVQRLIVLPVEGPVRARYEVASPSARGLLQHLQEVARLEALPAGWLAAHAAAGRRLRPGELGLRVRFEDFAVEADRLSAVFAVDLEEPGRPPVTLAPEIRLAGSAVTLPWFLARRSPWPVRIGVGLLGLALLAAGGWLGYLYYWLVEGRNVGPPAWAPALNRLRAASGLMASSLLLLAGFLLLVLTFLLAPATGQALGVQRVHLDVLVDGDEFLLPAAAFRQPSNALAATVADLGARVMGALEMRDPAREELEADVEGRVAWLRHRLPTLLRAGETRLRINRGASWRVFAASEGQFVAASPELQWPDPEPAARRRTVAEALDALARRMPERGFGMPLPWTTNGVPPLDPSTRAALGQSGQLDEGPSRLGTLVLSTFQAPSRAYAMHWHAAASNRPPGERLYGLLLPALPRSANREWESFEGRLLAAQSLCDRVVAAQAEPPELATNDVALAGLGAATGRPLRPDAAFPIFPHDGLGLRWLRNAAVPADLTRDAATLFGADRVQADALDRIALDVRTWLLGGRAGAQHTLVFTLPRLATYVLVLGLGLVFVVAGIRSEQNALGVPGWLPPLTTLVSAAALPVIAGLWIHARHDTTRFVVFGFADLAFWGVLFLWLCAGVAPFFLGRAHAGLPRHPVQAVTLAAALMLLAAAPLLAGDTRAALARAALLAVPLLAGLTLAVALVRRALPPSLAVTLLLFLGAAAGYRWAWGWAGQDLAALSLLATFLVMVASGWGHGVSWWQVTRHVEYDHIPWLRPAQRLLFAFLLSLAGAATLYCSFPALQATGLIRGYASYSVMLTILPYLVCALLVVLVDALERDTR